jgi:hypothetical protein
MSQPPMPPGPPAQPLPQPQFQTWPLQGMPPDGVQPQQDPVPVQEPPKKAKRFGWPTVIVTAVVALSLGGIVGGIAGGIVGGSGDGTATTAEPNATVTVTETADDESASKAPSPKKTTEPEPESTMEEGTYEIGVDAKPGRYKTRVPEDSSGCYWEKLKDDSGGLDSVIANGEVNAGGRVSITLKRGEFFMAEDCGTWIRV